MTAAPATTALPLPGWRDGATYGALGLPLAFVALPLYVLLPSHYAQRFGVPLAALGALLLAARAFDAVTDPWIGRFVDRCFTRSRRGVLALAAGAAVLLALGFHALFFPPVRGTAALLAWCAAALVLTYAAYSVASVLHQAWGVRLGGAPARQARFAAWREGLALVGVVTASILPGTLGLGVTGAVFAVLLVAAWAALTRAPQPEAGGAGGASEGPPPDLAAPLRTPAFRRLLAVYLLNGIASAVPATLVLFFVRDRLQAPAWEPVFLATYFAAGALSLPGWVRVIAAWGLERAWLAGMALAIATFAFAAALGTGDTLAFLAVCAASGLALGADLAAPGALLTQVVQRAGHAGRLEGGYVGWWHLATKLNLALAAGLALPLLAAFGYAPGRHDEAALAALTLAYCGLPCLLKAGAAALLAAQRGRLAHVTPEPHP